MNEYNGWHNYETWAVKLWIDNEEPSYRYWQEATRAAWGDPEEWDGESNRSRKARMALADQLKDEYAENAPELDGIYSDLLGAALSEVDWYEIADSMLTDAELEGYEPRK